jgi:hypothetical protein
MEPRDCENIESLLFFGFSLPRYQRKRILWKTGMGREASTGRPMDSHASSAKVLVHYAFHITRVNTWGRRVAHAI